MSAALAAASLEIDRKDLALALKVVAKSIGKNPGDASLRFDQGNLFIEAFNAAASAPARGIWPVPIFVSAGWVRRMAWRKPSGDPLHLEIRDDQICLERYCERCSLTPTEVVETPELPERLLDPELPQIEEKRLMEEAAMILKPLLIKASDLEQLVSEARAKGVAPWSMDEKRMIAMVAKAWILLAPLGIETADLRRLITKTICNAWK